MGREKDVIRVLEPEEPKHPDDLAVAYLLGTALIRDKQVEKGQLLVDRILRNGDSAEAHLMLGSAKMNVADFAGDRKSTRLNSSHRCSSYAVFCLKKKIDMSEATTGNGDGATTVAAGVSPAITEPPREKLTKKAITAAKPTRCPGCGDFAVTPALY